MQRSNSNRQHAGFWSPGNPLVVLLLTGVILALGSMASRGADDDACERPVKLLFGLIPAEKEAAYANEIKSYYETILFPYLKQKTGIAVETKAFAATRHTELMKAMQVKGGHVKKVHVALLGPYSFFLLREKLPSIQAFATYKRPQGLLQEAGTFYRAVLITKNNGNFPDYNSLQGHRVHVPSDRESTSGNLVPHALFAQHVNTDLRDYFDVQSNYGQDELIKKVHEGAIEAAFVATYRFDHVVEREGFENKAFKVLWSSEEIPGNPVAYRSDLCEELKNNIKEAFLTLHEQDNAKAFFESMRADKFVEVATADYDKIGDWKRIRYEVEHRKK